MTSFWLVQRQPTSKTTDILTATKNTTGEEYVKVDERHNRRSRKNAEKITHDINDGHQKTRYSSQIGLIYLKPVVHYTTSVYFHSNNDLSEEPRSPRDIRYDIYSTCVTQFNFSLQIQLFSVKMKYDSLITIIYVVFISNYIRTKTSSLLDC